MSSAIGILGFSPRDKRSELEIELRDSYILKFSESIRKVNSLYQIIIRAAQQLDWCTLANESRNFSQETTLISNDLFFALPHLGADCRGRQTFQRLLLGLSQIDRNLKELRNVLYTIEYSAVWNAAFHEKFRIGHWELNHLTSSIQTSIQKLHKKFPDS